MDLRPSTVAVKRRWSRIDAAELTPIRKYEPYRRGAKTQSRRDFNRIVVLITNLIKSELLKWQRRAFHTLISAALRLCGEGLIC